MSHYYLSVQAISHNMLNRFYPYTVRVHSYTLEAQTGTDQSVRFNFMRTLFSLDGNSMHELRMDQFYPLISLGCGLTCSHVIQRSSHLSESCATQVLKYIKVSTEVHINKQAYFYKTLMQTILSPATGMITAYLRIFF